MGIDAGFDMVSRLSEGPVDKHLIETVDESWIKSIPLVKGPRPQPNFAVGLRLSAFTANQLKKLQPSIGD